MDWRTGLPRGFRGSSRARRVGAREEDSLGRRHHDVAEADLAVVALQHQGAGGVFPAGELDELERLRLVDPVHATDFDRSGDELLDGLYVELAPWASHLFSIGPVALATAPQEEP